MILFTVLYKVVLTFESVAYFLTTGITTYIILFWLIQTKPVEGQGGKTNTRNMVDLFL